MTYFTDTNVAVSAQPSRIAAFFDAIALKARQRKAYRQTFNELCTMTSRDLADENHDAEREFYVHLMAKGVIVPGIHLFFLSTAHTPEDVDAVADAFCASLQDVREDGLI